jgi:DNA-binding IclR family transcriptional regulator
MARFTLAPESANPDFERGIRAVGRALHVLCAMAPSERTSWSLDELSRATDLPKSTTHRLLETMTACGFVEHGLAPGYYRLGLQAAIVGSAAARARRPSESVQRIVSAVQARTQETTGLGVLFGHYWVTVARSVSTQPLHWSNPVGGIYPAHASAGGKMALASMPPEELDEQLERMAPLQRFTPNTLVDVQHLRDQLDQIRVDGYAFDDEEHVPGLCCIAVPIQTGAGPRDPVAQDASSCVGPIVRHCVGLQVPSVRADRASLTRTVPLLRTAASELAVFLEMQEYS